MEYLYAALMLHSVGTEITEKSMKEVLSSANAEVDDAKIKSLVESLKGVDIEEMLKSAPVATAPVAAAPAKELAAEKKVEEVITEAIPVKEKKAEEIVKKEKVKEKVVTQEGEIPEERGGEQDHGKNPARGGNGGRVPRSVEGDRQDDAHGPSRNQRTDHVLVGSVSVVWLVLVAFHGQFSFRVVCASQLKTCSCSGVRQRWPLQPAPSSPRPPLSAPTSRRSRVLPKTPREDPWR